MRQLPVRGVVLVVAFLAACSSSPSSPAPDAGQTDAGQPDAGHAICGNGTVEGSEVCDEGAANGTPGGHCKADCSGLPKQVSIKGDVLAFLTEVEGPRLPDVQLSVVERPELVVDAGADAHFEIDGLYEGDEVTLVATQASLQPTTTATITLGAGGIVPFPVQVLPSSLFAALSTLLPQPPALDQYCAIATTVSRMGGSVYTSQRQGMPGVTVTLDPAVDASSGPIYFNTSALPDTTLTATTIDGGVLFYRVPPGHYVLKASLAGARFSTVKVNCTIGAIVNGGPPLGLLANVTTPDYAAGVGRVDDAYSASTDAFCDETATCVNTPSTLGYPPALQASCKAMYRNMWADVDPTCDATAGVRDAAKTFFDCRATNCTNALGGDTVCAAEDAAFRAAETSYGACVSAQSP